MIGAVSILYFLSSVDHHEHHEERLSLHKAELKAAPLDTHKVEPSNHLSHSYRQDAQNHRLNSAEPNPSVSNLFYGSANIGLSPADSKPQTENHYASTLYDNATPTPTSMPVTVAIPGYDNVDCGTPISRMAVGSPKYDLVPKELTASHESAKSERIYAEVTEDFFGPSKTCPECTTTNGRII